MRIFAAWFVLIGYSASSASSADMSFDHQPGRVEVVLKGKPLTTLYHDGKWDKPFLYPIRTVSGMVVSRGWPVEPRPGEEQDHVWHRGLWWGHGDINGEDFWREKPDKSTSRLALDGRAKTSSDTLEMKLAMITSKGKRLGTVTHRYAFRPDGGNLLIDAAVTISA